MYEIKLLDREIVDKVASLSPLEYDEVSEILKYNVVRPDQLCWLSRNSRSNLTFLMRKSHNVKTDEFNESKIDPVFLFKTKSTKGILFIKVNDKFIKFLENAWSK